MTSPAMKRRARSRDDGSETQPRATSGLPPHGQRIIPQLPYADLEAAVVQYQAALELGQRETDCHFFIGRNQLRLGEICRFKHAIPQITMYLQCS